LVVAVAGQIPQVLVLAAAVVDKLALVVWGEIVVTLAPLHKVALRVDQLHHFLREPQIKVKAALVLLLRL
jgi:hypothetical protein